MDLRRRLPTLLLLGGGGALAVAVPLLLRLGEPAIELPWVAAMVLFLIVAAYTWRRLPHHPAAWWFAVAAGTAALVQGSDGAGVLARAGRIEPAGLALLMFVRQVGIVCAAVAFAHLLGLFPDGRPQRRYERLLLRGSWLFLVFPPLVLLARPTVLFASYHQVAETPNPFALPGLAPVGEVAGILTTASQALFVVGVVLLVLRYRRSVADLRRRIRWLLLPAVLAVFAVAVDLLVGGPELLLVLLWIGALVILPLTIAVALLRPDLLDVDAVLRKSLVYGLLWLLIAMAYVAVAAGLGVAAGQRFPVTTAITLTVVATLLFQPARQRLERIADRWVFGRRADPSQLVARLGETLSEAFDLEALLPRMAATLERGLGLRWARVRLEPAPPEDGEPPVLAVPIELGGDRLGVVECGPKETGRFTDDDKAVVTTLANQAALAVRNVRLTAQLAAQAEQLAASRTRLVRAQEVERRRIERNIHDGVQQDLVALIGQVGHIRTQLRRDPGDGEALFADLQAGLRRVVADLRELAHGIHPNLLSDRGLLAAVEELAARSPIPVQVRADPTLRGARFAEEIEGAGYFTVAESLANVLKHAAATQAQVTLARANGTLRIEVADDGAGFDVGAASGDGLWNLSERLAALGGELDVSSQPGHGTTVRALLQVVEAGVADG